MPLFGSRNDPPADSPGAGPRGDLPQHAMQRLAELRGEGGKTLFTSDLTVNEFLLVKQAGFEPLGLVIGSSIYHIGFQPGNWTQNMELDTLSQAMYHARDLAMSRMQQEALTLGAEGIVGVQIQERSHGWGSHVVEYFAVGTAIISEAGDHPLPTPGFTLNVGESASSRGFVMPSYAPPAGSAH